MSVGVKKRRPGFNPSKLAARERGKGGSESVVGQQQVVEASCIHLNDNFNNPCNCITPHLTFDPTTWCWKSRLRISVLAVSQRVEASLQVESGELLSAAPAAAARPGRYQPAGLPIIQSSSLPRHWMVVQGECYVTCDLLVVMTWKA